MRSRRLFFSTTTKWAFFLSTGGFCILIQAAFFASASHDGVLPGLLFSLLSIPYILVFWACSFRKRRLSPIITIKKVIKRFTGSTSSSKKKNIRHIERLWVDGQRRAKWEGGRCCCCVLVCFCGLGVLDFFWATWGQISRCGAGWQRHCAVFVGCWGNLSEPGISGSVGRGWLRSWLPFPLSYFLLVHFLVSFSWLRCIMG